MSLSDFLKKLSNSYMSKLLDGASTEQKSFSLHDDFSVILPSCTEYNPNNKHLNPLTQTLKNTYS